jgi:hypothetical protein
MNDRPPTRFEIRLPADLGDQIDDWRRKQPDLPPRAEAARRLIEVGLKAPAVVTTAPGTKKRSRR